MIDDEATPADGGACRNVWLYWHTCSVWCRPHDRVHAILGFGDLMPAGRRIDSIWGRLDVLDSTLAEAPPASDGRPATLMIARFLDGEPSPVPDHARRTEDGRTVWP